MYRLISRYTRRLPASRILVAAITGSTLLAAVSAAQAQTTVYTDQYGNPTVSVDLSVLNTLGPPQNMPEFYRKTAPLPSRPMMATTAPPAPSGSRGSLAPPPRGMPRSTLNVPSVALPKQPSNRPKLGTVTRSAPLVRSTPTRRVVAPPAAKLSRAAPPPKLAPVAPPAAKPAPAAPTRTASAPPPRPSIAPRVPAPPAPPPALKAVRPPATPAPRIARPAIAKPPAAKTALAPPPKAAIAAPSRAVAPPPPLAAPKVAPATVTPAAPKTAALALPRQPAARPAEPIGEIVISPDGNLYSVPFARGSVDLPGNAAQPLKQLAARMKSDEALRIQLMGFAVGGKGSASQARRSSLFRALSIRTFLMKEGIRSTRMDVRALGQTSVEGVPPDRVDIVVQQQ